MKKLYFVIFIVVTLGTSIAVYGQEKHYESKEEIKVTLTQMKDLLSKLNDEDLSDKATKALKLAKAYDFVNSLPKKLTTVKIAIKTRPIQAITTNKLTLNFFPKTTKP